VIYGVLMRFVGSDGTPKTRDVGKDEVLVTCYLLVCPFRMSSFVDVPLLVRGSS
jgi:hypothetical protein